MEQEKLEGYVDRILDCSNNAVALEMTINEHYEVIKVRKYPEELEAKLVEFDS